MRVSNSENIGRNIFRINLLQSKISEQQTQLATGKKYQKLSDEPLLANQNTVIKHSMDRINQYGKNIDDLKGFLSMTESTLASTVNVLQNARERGLMAANSSYSAQDKETFINEIEHSIEQVVGLANTKYLGKYIFSGEKTKTEPFTYDGTIATYNGDTTNIEFQVSNAMKVKTSETGDVAFQGVLDSLIYLRDQIQTGTNLDIQNAIDGLDTELNKTINLRSELGTRMNAADTMNEILENTTVDLMAKKEKIEGIDFAEVLAQFSNTQLMYQATIQSSARVMQTSLMDYI